MKLKIELDLEPKELLKCLGLAVLNASVFNQETVDRILKLLEDMK